MIDPRVRVSEHLEEWALVLTDGEDIVAALTFYPPDELASQHQLGTIHMMIMTRMMAESGAFSITARIDKGSERTFARLW